jgi:hypothetical protein
VRGKMNRSADAEIEALAAIYAADRQDGNNMIITSLTMISLGLTYIGITYQLTDGLSTIEAGWRLAVLPVPVIIVVAFHSVFLHAGVLRAVSTAHLERRLIGDGSLVSSDGSVMGVQAAEPALNIAHPNTTMYSRLALAIGYGGIGVIAIAYTVLCIVNASDVVGWLALSAISFTYACCLLAISGNYLKAAKIAGASILADPMPSPEKRSP